MSFKFDEYINISDYLLDKDLKKIIYYELICFIINKSEAWCKSPIDNEWYIYQEKNVIKNNQIKNQMMTIPYCLIYKRNENVK